MSTLVQQTTPTPLPPTTLAVLIMSTIPAAVESLVDKLIRSITGLTLQVYFPSNKMFRSIPIMSEPRKTPGTSSSAASLRHATSEVTNSAHKATWARYWSSQFILEVHRLQGQRRDETKPRVSKECSECTTAMTWHMLSTVG